MLKNVAGQHIAAQLIAKADGTPITSGTTTVYVTIDGGTQGSGGGTVTHKGNGEWDYAPTQGETNGNHIAYTWVHADAINVTKDVYTIPSTPWTEDEKEQIRYRMQLNGTQTAPATNAPLQMPVSTDALNQSEQFAQDLAEIFDNTAPRKRLYVEGIDINPPEGTTGIDITGEGFPLNITCQNSANLPAITIKGGGTTGEEIHLTNGKTNLLNLIRAEILNATGLNDYPNSSVGRRLSRIPNEDPGTEGGLPTVDAENRIAGIQGTKNTLDALNDISSTGAEAAAAAALNTYNGPTKAELDAAQASIEALIDQVLNNTTLPNTLYVDAAGGNDGNDGSTWAKAKATLTAAKNAATAGTTIFVAASNYNENNLLKDGVNWHFYTGAIVDYTGAGPGGILDDSANGANGAIKCRITGQGVFTSSATFAGDLIHIENANSQIFLTCDHIGEDTNETGVYDSGVTLAAGYLRIKCNSIDAKALAGAFTTQLTGGTLDLIGKMIIGDGVRNTGALVNIFGDLSTHNYCVDSTDTGAITNIYNSTLQTITPLDTGAIHASAGIINAYNSKLLNNKPSGNPATVEISAGGHIYLNNCALKNENATGLEINNDGGEIVIANTDYDTSKTNGTITFAPANSGGGATPAEVKDKIIEALSVDTYSDPSAPPPNPASLKDMIAWIFARGLGVFVQTAIDQTLKNRAGDANIAQRTIEATPTQVTLGEWQP